MKLSWDQLLSDFRPARPGNQPKASSPDPHRSAFEADYDRVVYSSPFRRLARKTQVHPLSPNDHVHNRLTHSIEVASVGRSLAKRLGKFLVNRNELPANRTIDDLCQILMASCLAHDIGNPPFGHAGEFAIREWVRVHKDRIFASTTVKRDNALQSDFLLFEGNAQGFRLTARTDNAKTGYMRLTYATLGAMIKYPWDSTDTRAKTKEKFNVFSTERVLFDEMSIQLGLKSKAAIARHPLSFLSEAADDICYRLLDLEDAVDLKILDPNLVRPIFLDFLGENQSDLPLSALRGKVIATLSDSCWQVFHDDYESIMSGNRTDDLKSGLDEEMTLVLKEVKKLYGRIFAERTKVAVELGAYETLGRIIDVSTNAVQELSGFQDYDKTDFLTRRRLDLAWGEAYAREHQTQSYSWWLHQVMDYVSGLTDNYARQLSREIAGL